MRIVKNKQNNQVLVPEKLFKILQKVNEDQSILKVGPDRQPVDRLVQFQVFHE